MYVHWKVQRTGPTVCHMHAIFIFYAFCKWKPKNGMGDRLRMKKISLKFIYGIRVWEEKSLWSGQMSVQCQILLQILECLRFFVFGTCFSAQCRIGTVPEFTWIWPRTLTCSGRESALLDDNLRRDESGGIEFGRLPAFVSFWARYG
jgi:hypothetical protein